MNLPPLTLECPAKDPRYVTARVGDRWTESLGPDEALWVASCYLRGEVHPWLQTDAEHDARKARLERISAEAIARESAEGGAR